MDIPRLHVLEQTPSLRALHAVMRDAGTDRAEFVFHANRLIRLLLENSLGLLPYREHAVRTPVGATYDGLALATRLCAVSVVRAGESMEFELAAMMPNMSIGKVLIQRDKLTKQPSLLYCALPAGIEEGHVLLLEPMLATGGSALMALRVLLERGVREESIIFVNILASPEGLTRLAQAHPRVRIVTSSVELRLNDDAYMIPGIGDFGDRYFGTASGSMA